MTSDEQPRLPLKILRIRNSPTINNKGRASLPRELPKPLSAKSNDAERTNTPHYKS